METEFSADSIVKNWKIFVNSDFILVELENNNSMSVEGKLAFAKHQQDIDSVESLRRLTRFIVEREPSVDLGGLHCCLTGEIHLTEKAREINIYSSPITRIELLPYFIDKNGKPTSARISPHSAAYAITTIMDKVYYVTTTDVAHDLIKDLISAVSQYYAPTTTSKESS